MNESFITTNHVKLHVVSAGRPDGPLVVLLHGFPEYWRAWQHQMPVLAEAGYYVVAPTCHPPKGCYNQSVTQFSQHSPRSNP